MMCLLRSNMYVCSASALHRSKPLSLAYQLNPIAVLVSRCDVIAYGGGGSGVGGIAHVSSTIDSIIVVSVHELPVFAQFWLTGVVFVGDVTRHTSGGGDDGGGAGGGGAGGAGGGGGVEVGLCRQCIETSATRRRCDGC